MDYKAALDALKKLDGGTELASTVETELERLTSKNYELIGENRKATSKATNLQQSIEAIAETLGTEGDDLESKLKGAAERVKTLSSQLSEANTNLAATETRASDAETKLTGLERKAITQTASTKLGANADVLERLLGDRLKDLKIEGDNVMLDDKPLRDFVEGDESLRAFIPALFPDQTQEKTTQARLPGGTPNGQTTPNAADQAYVRATGRSPDADTSWVGGQK